MSLARFSPAARQSAPDSTPWPMSTAPTGSSATADPNEGINTRQENSSFRSSPRKMKGRPPRQERAAEEDIKFNVGPKRPRPTLARRLMRRAHPERVIDPYTMDIPDYPPPSFQEAISTPSVSISPTATIAPTLPLPPQADESSHDPGLDARQSHESVIPIPSEQRTSTTSDSDSGSDNDFVDVPRTRDDVPLDPIQDRVEENENRDGLTFPSPPPRGRTSSRVALEDYPGEDEECITQSAPTTRRHNSLSPLRTLFTSLPFTLHDRAASAHPTTEPPSSSPYAPSRSMSFFRSTTSLALLGGGTTPTLKTKPSITNILTPSASPKRRLFSQSKSKAPPRLERPEIDPDSETWEIVDASDANSVVDLPLEPKSKDKKKKDKEKEKKERRETQRASLLSVDVPTPEPFRDQSESTCVSTFFTSTPLEALPPQLLPQLQIQQPQPQRQPTVHPLSLHDRKVPIPSATPPRSPMTPPPHSASPLSTPSRTLHSPESPLSSPTKTANSGPQVASVRRWHTAGSLQPLITQRTQVFNASPLGAQAWKAEESPTVAGSEGVDSPLRSALETPLPPSPTDSVRLASPYNGTTNPGFSSSVIADIAGLQFIPSMDSFTTALDTSAFASGSGADTPTRKHYHGRPLPPAPGSGAARTPIEPLYLPAMSLHGETCREKKQGNGHCTSCPEGLLIDLADNTFVSGMNRSHAARSQVDLVLPAATASPLTSYPVIGCGHNHCGHMAPASMSTPNLSQPIFSTPLHVVSMTPSQSQSNRGPHLWTPMSPLCTIASDTPWLCDCGGDHGYESGKYWERQQLPPSPKDIKNVPPSPHMAHPHYVHPFALALARAQTHPSASLGPGPCMVSPTLHTNGR